MVTEGTNKLAEGISYLTGFDTTYNPEDKEAKKPYTFHFIRDTLDYFHLGRFIDNIVEIIVFDSIIGNGDRHQENWGIITNYTEVIKTIKDLAKKADKGFKEKLLFTIMAITNKTRRKEIDNLMKDLHIIMPGMFSEIYDSGSCLGRELSADKVMQMLTDQIMIEGYIRKGVSEIHWKGVKLNHFDLIEKVKEEHPEKVFELIDMVRNRFNENKLKDTIFSVDSKLPKEFEVYKLPEDRKKFINKLITLRVGKLIQIKP